MMANTTNTLAEEFARHRFYPLYLSEHRAGKGLWGGCLLVLKNCASWKRCNPYPVLGRAPRDLDLYFAPKRTEHRGSRSYPFELDVVVYNRRQEALLVDAHLTARNQEGGVIDRVGPVRLDLEPRVAKDDDPPSASKSFEAGLDLGSADSRVSVELEVEDANTRSVLNTRRLAVGMV